VRLRRNGGASGRFLTTILFVDIVGSTELAGEIGDAAWRNLLGRYLALARDRLKRLGGREIDTAGDGLFAAFPVPADAVACAMAIRDAAAGLGVSVRAGLHMGEVETIDGKVGGIAVHIGARIAAAAGRGEVLVSSTVRDLVTGSRLRFEDRGEVPLKGVAEPWHLYLAQAPAPAQPVLDAASTDAHAGGRLPSLPHSTRVRVGILASVVAVATVVGAADMLLATGPSVSPSPSGAGATAAPSVPVVADSVGRVDETGRVSSSVAVGAQPNAITLGGGSVWVTDSSTDAVTRLDATGSAVIQRIPVGASPAGLAYGFGAVWVANSGDRTVSRIDPTTNEVVAVIPVGTAPEGITTDDQAVWVTNRLDHTISRIDPASGATTHYAAGATPLGIAMADGELWIADADANVVMEMDPSTGVIRSQVQVGHGPSAIAATPAGDAVWVVNERDGTVSRISTATASVTDTHPVGAEPTGVAAGDRAVWVAVAGGSQLVELDATTAAVNGRFDLDVSPQAVTVDAGDGAVFTARERAGQHRGGTLRIVSPVVGFPTDTDPSYQFGPLSTLTSDALVAYKAVGGPDGLTIVPDLAVRMPTSADGGRTWNVQLRSGITYSTGQPVRASDVLRSVERTVLTGIPAPEVAGAKACHLADGAPAAACDLSAAITTDDQAGTVTIRLESPDPDYVTWLAGAFIVPSDTPYAESAAPLPATGPYVVDRFTPGTELHLKRNPDFHEWSHDAQPDGYPDEIEWQASSVADPSTLVETGKADLVVNNTWSAERLAQLRTRAPAQLHVGPSLETWFEMMNTTVPPFNDVRVRQAVNYAADRTAIVDAWGGPLSGRVTCQAIPPEFTGYEAYCPYTVDPGTNGAWLGRDVPKAQQLIAQAGVKGMHVTVWGLDDGGGQHTAVARYFTDLLNQLGFVATTKLVPFESYFEEIGAKPRSVQMAGFWLLSATRSGGDMLVGMFTCPDFPAQSYNGHPADFCDRSIDAQVRQAEALQATDPLAADKLWASIDRRVVDAAPAVSAFNPTDVTFLSKRVGDYQHQPVYQLLIDQLWVQ